jgi:hypothetical protein
MKRKHSQEHLHSATDGESTRRAIRDQEPDQIIDLEKQYEELCRLREQVRKAERRRQLTRVPGRRQTPSGSALDCVIDFRHRRGVSALSTTLINSKGIHVANVFGSAIFDLMGQKIYELKGVNIYRLSGDLVGHLNNALGTETRLDRVTDRLFAVGRGRI